MQGYRRCTSHTVRDGSGLRLYLVWILVASFCTDVLHWLTIYGEQLTAAVPVLPAANPTCAPIPG